MKIKTIHLVENHNHKIFLWISDVGPFGLTLMLEFGGQIDSNDDTCARMSVR